MIMSKNHVLKIFLVLYIAQLALSDINTKNEKITGKIIDASTEEPLTGVNVFLEHTNIGATTNIDGEYIIINVPVGEYKLVASMIGYKMKHNFVLIRENEEIEANFQLEPTIYEMGAIVVTGTATPRLYENMPVKTEVIPQRLIIQKQAVNLTEALSFQTGVRVENNCQNCNFSQVRILGLDGKYSQILIDGDPVVSSLAGVYGLEHFPEEMINQIEIVKGGGSALYGGGAVAGVINLVTRHPKFNQIQLKYIGNSIDDHTDQHIGMMAELVNNNSNSGAYIFASARRRNPFDFNNDGFSELGLLKNESFGFNWYINPTKSSELITHFHRIHEERRGGNKFDLPVHEAEIAEWIEHWRTGGSIRWQQRLNPDFDYHVFYSLAIENRDSYYGGLAGNTDEDRLEALTFYGKSKNPLYLGGAQLNYKIKNHLITTGMQYLKDKIEDKAAAYPIYHINNVYKDLGIFLQDNIYFGKNQLIELVAGVRLDKHSEIDRIIFSPRIHGKFNLSKGLTLRTAFTTGFKAPQVYDEDLHLCGVGGEQKIIRNNPDLKEERSNSIICGIDFMNYINDMSAMFGITVFYTSLIDVFIETEADDPATTVAQEWNRINGEGAKVQGIELDMGIRPVTKLELRGGCTYQKSKLNKPEEDFGTKHFFRTPDFYGNFRISYDIFSMINLHALASYTDNAYLPHQTGERIDGTPIMKLERSENFFELNLGTTFKFQLLGSVNNKISLGIKNVFNEYQKDLDKGPTRDPAYVYGPYQPRTIYFAFETSF
jgi:outer membrane receptor for ferrienterochelin and colicins